MERARVGMDVAVEAILGCKRFANYLADVLQAFLHSFVALPLCVFFEHIYVLVAFSAGVLQVNTHGII